MKVLITGGSGFIGQHIINILKESGTELIVVGRRPISDGIEFQQIDLLHDQDFNRLFKEGKVTHLLHLAWIADHGKYWTSPLNSRWVAATCKLVEAFCKSGGKHFVASGTSAEYESSNSTCLEDSTPLHPASLYGVSKDKSRRLAKAICEENGVTCGWARIFQAYGPGEFPERLLPSIVDAFEGRREFFSIDSNLMRDFVHARDIATAMLVLLRTGAHGEFNISNNQPVKLADVIREIAEQLGKDANDFMRLSKTRPNEPRMLVGDNRKLLNLKWKPEYCFSSGIRQTLERNDAN